MIRYLILALMASFGSKATVETTEVKEALCEEIFYNSLTERESCKNDFSNEQVDLMQYAFDEIIDDGNWHDLFESEESIQGLKLILSVGPTSLIEAFDGWTGKEEKAFLDWIRMLSVEPTLLDDDVFNEYYRADYDYEEKGELLERVREFKTAHSTLIRDIKNLAGNLRKESQPMEQRMANKHGIKYYAQVRYTSPYRFWEEEKQEEWIILDLVNETNASWWDYRARTTDCSGSVPICVAVMDVVSSVEVGQRSPTSIDRDPGYKYFRCRQKFLSSVASCLEGLNFVSSAGRGVLPFQN